VAFIKEERKSRFFLEEKRYGKLDTVAVTSSSILAWIIEREEFEV
jgi:hypothetical protein